MKQQEYNIEDAKNMVNLDFSIMPKYLICMDKLDDISFAGRLYCGCIVEGRAFDSAEQLLISLDEIMDLTGLPQSTMDKKTFQKQKKADGEEPSTKITTEVQEAMKNYEAGTDKGTKATFVLQVQFRQNASWQGTVKSVETGENIPFRSALELIKIIDDISARGDVVDTHGLILPSDEDSF